MKHSRTTSKRKTAAPIAMICPAILSDQATFEAAVAVLARQDPGLVETLLGDRGMPSLRRRPSGFEGLVSIIVAQQVSTASAAAIFARLKARFGMLEAEPVRAASDADLRLCGLSAPKLRTIRAIAEAVFSRLLDFDALAAMDAEDAHRSLVAIKGIGPWTADVFLLFCLGHADAWPAGDLALQEAARLALNLPDRPTAKDLVAVGDRWRPLRGVAAHCLWAYYGATRNRQTTLETVSRAKTTGKTRKA